MPLIVDEPIAQANGRLTAVRLTLLTLRHMENLRAALIDDCKKVLILLAIVAISAERLTRESMLAEELRDLRHAVPREQLNRCNVSSIAAATGLNRETTRRKVNELVEAGIVQRSDDGIMRINPDLVPLSASADFVRRQLDTFVKIANELLRDGVIAVE